MPNIILVGFMGTGKTRVARALSERLGMKYVSTDDIIEEREKMSVSDIFSEKGEDYFRKVEKNVVKDVSIMENVVIDAGGGVIIDAENVKNLKEKGIVICLWAEPEVILERTKKYTHRPLLSVSDPLKKIKELLTFRKPFYERSDYHIYTSKMTLGHVVDETERMVSEATTYGGDSRR